MLATRDDDACTTHTAGLGWRDGDEEVEAHIKDRGVRTPRIDLLLFLLQFLTL